MSYSRDMSMRQSVRRTGYFDVLEEVSEADLRHAFEREPRLADEWLRWSEEKTTRDGAHVAVVDGQFSVITFAHGKPVTQVHHNDFFDAVAAFAKREVDDIRQRALADRRMRRSDAEALLSAEPEDDA